MTTSSEGHTYCTRDNSSERINTFTNNMEVQLNALNSTSDNPFNTNKEKEVPKSPTNKSPDPPTINQSIIEPSINNNISSLKIRINGNNSIIGTNHDKATSTLEYEVSIFQLKTKLIYKGTKAIIVVIIPQED